MKKLIDIILRNIGVITAALAAVTVVLMLLSIYMIFVFAPVEQFMGMPQKIFYFHVPIAMISYVGFFITFVCSIAYLVTGNLTWDRFAICGAQIGVLYITLTLLTGMLWGKPIWGVYWSWDPRLTTSFVLWLIYAGYLVLRSAVEDETMRAKYAAVMGIVGFADVPLVHYSVKLWSRGIHPVIERGPGDPGMHPDMFTTFKVSMITMLLLFVLLFITRVRYEFLAAEVEHIKSTGGAGGIGGKD